MTRAFARQEGHPEPHPLAGATVELKNVALDPREQILDGGSFCIEDWVDRLGRSWMLQENWATLHYGVRQLSSLSSDRRLPYDDEVVYGKIGAFGHCVHASELGEVIK